MEPISSSANPSVNEDSDEYLEEAEQNMLRAFDKIQKRYGWTDDYVLSIPYSRLMDLFSLIAREEQQEELNEWKKMAFIGFQTRQLEEGTTFNDYLQAFGLTDNQGDKESSYEMGEVWTKEECEAHVEQIMAHFQEDDEDAE
ncbi:hypothetical protein P5808_25950 [Bacillus cereus]|jgi:hypothetical protein|uniref:Uncharacterized protein n=1 Tax=Bacillus thuringiensis serovar kumamotoensis TaxID=132267 RepID=A0A9X6JJJ5_BACUK|nr:MULTISPECIES: hypothetical protein [Bacillus]EKS7844780.1 hypothetical protein [Bacillus cereus]MCU5668073.1 hypothetical protein [Bacillus cereus]MDA2330963.1 hypothetical protein [Bacillus cereus]MDA2336790.1 hypothetical protein [Bacillus cereus]MDA2355298.1 hypothetical protein [Bacillus cereus]